MLASFSAPLPELEQAAATLGARPLAAFLFVTLPPAAPGFLKKEAGSFYFPEPTHERIPHGAERSFPALFPPVEQLFFLRLTDASRKECRETSTQPPVG